MLQCPECKSYGIYPVKRQWWQRLLKLPHRYYCFDCAEEVGHVKAETDKQISRA